MTYFMVYMIICRKSPLYCFSALHENCRVDRTGLPKAMIMCLILRPSYVVTSSVSIGYKQRYASINLALIDKILLSPVF